MIRHMHNCTCNDVPWERMYKLKSWSQFDAHDLWKNSTLHENKCYFRVPVRRFMCFVVNSSLVSIWLNTHYKFQDRRRRDLQHLHGPSKARHQTEVSQSFWKCIRTQWSQVLGGKSFCRKSRDTQPGDERYLSSWSTRQRWIRKALGERPAACMLFIEALEHPWKVSLRPLQIWKTPEQYIASVRIDVRGMWRSTSRGAVLLLFFVCFHVCMYTLMCA